MRKSFMHPLDVLTASELDNKIAWYQNDGKGNFGPQQLITSQASKASAVYTADLDNDGDQDVLSASNNLIAWYTNDGSGKFGAQQIITTQAKLATSVHAADLDGDGDTDVLSTSYDEIPLAWYENDGAGNFGQPQAFPSQQIYNEMEVVYTADLDGDGDPDVLAASLFSDRIVWYENDGKGNFNIEQPIDTQAYDAQDVFPVDMDNDGDLDILSAFRHSLAWYESDGEGNFGPPQLITEQAYNVRSVFAKDLDGDGDADVLSASGFDINDDKIAWYENLDGVAFGEQQVITTLAIIPLAVYADDLDGDGDPDVLSASYRDYKTAWYANDGMGNFGTEYIITSHVLGLLSIHTADLDNDGDQDVLSASSFFDNNKIAWYQNDGTGNFGPQQIITYQANGARLVYTADLDGDGDPDVLSASSHSSTDKIAWYENDGNGNFGQQQIITTQTDDVISIYTIDLDGDGDQDVLSASSDDNKIAWYQNDGTGSFGPQQIISTQVRNASSVFAIDLDGDGDQDVLSASAWFFDNSIAWYENDGQANFSEPKGITSETSLAQTVYAADLDGDGDPDVLSASKHDNKIAWYENDGKGNFGPQKVISLLTDGAIDVYTTDLDEDGDQDVVSASSDDNKIAWYQNDGTGSFGPQQIIMLQSRSAIMVHASDLDGDGDQDVLSSSGFQDDYKIAWYENLWVSNLTLNSSMCQGDTLMFDGQPLVEGGTYSSTFTSSLGYDSIVVLNLSIVPSFEIAHKETICYGDSLLVAGQYYAEPGTYFDTLQSSLGCDSVIVTELFVDELEPEIYFLNDTLFSAFQEGEFQWLDCSTNEEIPGATQSHFTPDLGSYAVKIDNGDCQFISKCFDTTITGTTNSLSSQSYIIAPNPTHNHITISFKGEKLKYLLVLDISGEIVIKKKINALSEVELNLSPLSEGVYSVVLVSENDAVVKKIIKI